MYIQIFEGVLRPEAIVSDSTDRYSIIKTVEPTESSTDVYKIKLMFAVIVKTCIKFIFHDFFVADIENKLIHKIQWDSGKGVYLTKNSLVPKGFVLVGLGFGVTKDKVLHLVTYVKNSDYQTGKLMGDVVAYHHIPNPREVYVNHTLFKI